MAEQVVRAQFDYSNTPGAVPNRPILPGGAAIQQADGKLLTLKSDGTTRATPLDVDVEGGLASVEAVADLAARALPKLPYQAVTVSAPATTLSVSDAAYVKLTLAVSTALSLTEWPAAPETGRLTLELNIASGATITAWPAGVLWASGVAPALSTGPATDLVVFTSINGGATVFGSVVGQSYAPA